VTPDVIVVGGEFAGFPTLDGDVVSSVFDDDTDSWTLTTRGGETRRSRIVIAAKSPLTPWIPDLFGRRSFRGRSFHAAAPPADFDPAGRRVAVVGADSGAGRLIPQLAASAAAVTVFPVAPRRFVGSRRYLRRCRPTVVTSPVEEVTAAGIRTADGMHHDADAIVYGTGFAVPADLPHDGLVGARGLTIQQAWTDGTEPYLGVALHGFPNYFIGDGPVLECLQRVNRHTRIEVRRSSQQVFNERVHLHRPGTGGLASDFDVSSLSEVVHDDTYDGPAMLTAAHICEQVRVRLTGHIDPIDGQYHWQGSVFGELPADLTGTVTLAVGDRSASARITEKTPQGTHTVAGAGRPPFVLSDYDVKRVV
jgi:uncharacterized protein DUF4873